MAKNLSHFIVGTGDKYDMMASIEKFWVQNPISVLFDLKLFK